jgi:hypothetical protein
VSFFTLALYVAALVLVRPVPDAEGDVRRVLADYRRLSLPEQTAVREALEDPADRRRLLG